MKRTMITMLTMRLEEMKMKVILAMAMATEIVHEKATVKILDRVQRSPRLKPCRYHKDQNRSSNTGGMRQQFCRLSDAQDLLLPVH